MNKPSLPDYMQKQYEDNQALSKKLALKKEYTTIIRELAQLNAAHAAVTSPLKLRLAELKVQLS